MYFLNLICASRALLIDEYTGSDQFILVSQPLHDKMWLVCYLMINNLVLQPYQITWVGILYMQACQNIYEAVWLVSIYQLAVHPIWEQPTARVRQIEDLLSKSDWLWWWFCFSLQLLAMILTVVSSSSDWNARLVCLSISWLRNEDEYWSTTRGSLPVGNSMTGSGLPTNWWS